MRKFHFQTFLLAFGTSFFIGEVLVFLLSFFAFFPVFKSYWGGVFMPGSPAQHAFSYMTLFHLIFSLCYGIYITFSHEELNKLQIAEKIWTIFLYIIIIGFLTSVLLIITGIIPAALNEYTATVAMGPATGHVVSAVFMINAVLWISFGLYISVGTVMTIRLLKKIPLSTPKIHL